MTKVAPSLKLVFTYPSMLLISLMCLIYLVRDFKIIFK